MLVGMGTLIEKGYYTLPTLQEKVSVKGGVTGKGIEILENYQIEEMFRRVYKATQKKYNEDRDHIMKQFNFYDNRYST